MKPKVLVLKTDGINRDEDLKFAFKLAGGDPKIVHINDLRSKKESFKKYKILAIPGGFSYGDDVASGKILAIELTSYLSDEIKKFIEKRDTAIIGICNGFQVLVRTGILPLSTFGKMKTTLTFNDSGHFECRWINVKVENNTKSLFLNKLKNEIISYPIAHGEGKFFTDDKTLKEIEEKNLVAFRYVDENGNITQKYPNNPNGALNSIAGVSDPTGRILGLMPHPECYVQKEAHPNWRRNSVYAQGLPIFKEMISFVKNS